MRMLERIGKIENITGNPRARYVVYAAQIEDSPEAIDSAIKIAAKEIGVPLDAVDMAILFLPDELREIKINPHAEFSRLSGKGVMSRVLVDLDCRDTGLPRLKLSKEFQR